MAQFLVTGGAGFLGSHLIGDLLARGHRVRVLDDLSTGTRANVPAAAELIEGDVTNNLTVERAFQGIDGCFHLAATACVERCHRDWVRSHQVNLTGTINVFEQARRSSRADRAVPVVYASTAAVYGNCEAVPITEECSIAPTSAYGADKAAAELHARIAGSVHGVPTVGLRFFNLFGPRQDPRSRYSGVISIFAEQLLRGQPIEIFGDGGQVRDFVYVGDAAKALYAAMTLSSTAAPVFNICSGTGTSLIGLAETIAELCDTRLVIRHSEPRRGDIRTSIGDPSLAAEQLDFRVRTPLADGLAVTLTALAERIPTDIAIAAD